MIPFELVSIFVDLQRPEARPVATDELARYLGVAGVMLFGRDAELGIFLPAPGLPQTLRAGRRWQDFLRLCADKGSAQSALPVDERQPDAPVWGVCDDTANVILVFIGADPPSAMRLAVAALLPLLGAKLVAERAELVAEGHATAAREGNRRASELNAALDASRRELQTAYRRVERELVSRRAVEARLRDADRRKDEFLAMLAHELRNPLAPIGMAAQILRLGQSTPARIKETCAIIDRQVAHMTNLLDDLLDVSRVTGGFVELAQELHDMCAIVRDAVEQARPLVEARRHRLVLDVPARTVPVCGDSTRLVQIVANLLNNASKYTPPGGSIELALGHDDTTVELAVRDSGIGIEPELLPHVFDLFVQGERSPDRTQGGLGVGLALVKSLVERHGGSVHASSAGNGKGSAFTMRLPLAHGAMPPAGASQDSPSCDGARSILIVDDNIDAADTLSMFLDTIGYRSHVAYEGGSALALAAAHAPDILLLDIGLPDIDGHELARQMRALPQTRSATLVALTGYGQPTDRERSLAAGFDHHLTKPVDTAVLLRLIAQTAKKQSIPV